MLRGFLVVGFVLLASACVESGVDATAASERSDVVGAVGRLVYVFDGDSMEVDVDGSVEEVRLIGINAPEGNECFGDEARDALVSLTADRDLVLVMDSGDDIDQYGRLLRYVYVDNESVNTRMLADGGAITLQGDHRYNDEFVEIGNLAAEAMLGMWAPDACGPVSPYGATITNVEYDPPGPDDERLNDEYVTITNDGSKPSNLAGWTLRDESSRNRYSFEGFTLKPGEAVTVRTGCGEDHSDAVFWCSDRSVWSNGGDTVILQDRHGNVADRWTYAGTR